MNITKKPYEISLWDDVLTFVGRKPDGTIKEMQGSIASDFEGIIEAQYYKEVKLCVIGSSTMDAPIRAVKPKLESKISGENTLTFTIYSHYWNEDSGQLEWNPFMMYLTNERKVKLKYDNKWYDFIIKNINEDSSTKAFTYTCKDLFVNELSKTGFELEFDNKLGNNMGALPILGERILEGSDWKLKKEEIETIFQYLEEPLYELTLPENNQSFPSDLKIKCEYGKDGYNQEVDFPYGKTILIFYNSVKNEATETIGRLEFLYDSANQYPVDDKNIVIGYSKDNPQGISNYYLDNIIWKEDTFSKKTLSIFKGTKWNREF